MEPWRGRSPPLGYFPQPPNGPIMNSALSTPVPILSAKDGPHSVFQFSANAFTSSQSLHPGQAANPINTTYGSNVIPNPTPVSRATPRGRRGGRGSRGGRANVRVKVEPDADGVVPSNLEHAESPTPRNRGGRPRSSVRGSRIRVGRGGRDGFMGRVAGHKRSRGQDSDGEDGDQGSSSSEEMINLPSTTRSGRRITQNFSPVVLNLDDADPLGSQKPSNPTPRGGKGGGRGGSRLPKRKPGEAAVCRNCGRGYSPASNMIVFCDGCNTPWHQSCHDPPISGEIIRVEESQWFCGDCTYRNQEKSSWERRVGMENLSLVEQKHYLATLTRQELISLVLQAETMYPGLPMHVPPQAGEGEEEEPYGGGYLQERELLPYPRPGNGVKLRPESEDAMMLVDDNTEAFSHCFGWTHGDLFPQPSMNGQRVDDITMGGMGIQIGA